MRWFKHALAVMLYLAMTQLAGCDVAGTTKPTAHNDLEVDGSRYLRLDAELTTPEGAVSSIYSWNQNFCDDHFNFGLKYHNGNIALVTDTINYPGNQGHYISSNEPICLVGRGYKNLTALQFSIELKVEERSNDAVVIKLSGRIESIKSLVEDSVLYLQVIRGTWTAVPSDYPREGCEGTAELFNQDFREWIIENIYEPPPGVDHP